MRHVAVEPPDEADPGHHPQGHNRQIAAFAERLAEQKHQQREPQDAEEKQQFFDEVEAARWRSRRTNRSWRRLCHDSSLLLVGDRAESRGK